MLDVSRAEFLREFGHDEKNDHEQRLIPLHELSEAERQRSRTVLRRAVAGGLDPGFDNCGWWWCAEGERPRFGDLLRALHAMRAEGVEPCDAAVADVAHLYSSVQDWADQRKGYDDLRQRLERVRKALDTDGAEGDQLRLLEKWTQDFTRWDEELSALHAHALGAAGANTGRPRHIYTERTIAYARERGWSSSVLAAALMLTGAERGDWESLRKRFDVAFQRTNLRSIP